MPRPRKFDEAEVIEKAMLTFWQCGYDATTMKILQESTGVDGKGLANAFGDKEQIFLKVLDAYTDMASAVLSQVFAEPSIDSVIAFFGGIVDSDIDEEDPRQSGCLMVNTVFELGRTSDSVRKKVEKYRQLFLDCFELSLSASSIADPHQKSELLLGMLWGALSQIRLSGTIAAAKPMAREIINMLKSWT